MPAVSKAQQRLMGAAEHGASFPMARKVRASMSLGQLHDFAVGSMKGKPTHVKPASPRQAMAQTQGSGKVTAPKTSQTVPSESVPHPKLKNLGTYAHPKGGY